MLTATTTPSPTLSARSSPKSCPRGPSSRIRTSARNSGSSGASGSSRGSGAATALVSAPPPHPSSAVAGSTTSLTITGGSSPASTLAAVTASPAGSASVQNAAASAAPQPLSPLRRPRSSSHDGSGDTGVLMELVSRQNNPSPSAGKRLKVEHPPAQESTGDQQGAQAASGSSEEASTGATKAGEEEDEDRLTTIHMDDDIPEGHSEYRMPDNYEHCQALKLGACIAEMLGELIRINDQFPPRDGQLTRFHSRAPPDISAANYLSRLIVHATLPTPILLCMVYYIDRLCSLYPAFTINSLTVHRYLITAATVACKGLSDSFWTNNTYAKVGGISVRELASLEMELLARLEWRIVPNPDVLVNYYHSLVDNSKLYWLKGSAPKPRPDEQLSEKAKGDEKPLSDEKQTPGEKVQLADAPG